MTIASAIRIRGTSIYEVDAAAKYRYTPIAAALGDDRQRVRTCAAKSGHILRVSGDLITCVNCGAEWKDEGF